MHGFWRFNRATQTAPDVLAEPHRMACVVASCRDEGPYLLEWIAHHRAVGFDHIFLYTNDIQDGSDALLQALARAGEITWINQTGPAPLPPHRAYAHAMNVLPRIHDYRWTLIAALDEYFGFNPRQFGGVADFLACQEGRRDDAVVLPRLLHVARPDDVWHDAPCIMRFPLREAAVHDHLKSIFRTNSAWNTNAYFPDQRADPSGLELTEDACTSDAWIAQYKFKSAPEAVMQIQRGLGDATASRQVAIDAMARPFVTLSRRRALVEDGRTAACAAGLPAAQARLRALPGVAASDKAIKEEFATRMHDACLNFLREIPPAGEAEECATFRALLRQQRIHA